MADDQIVTDGDLSVRADSYAPYFLSLINNRPLLGGRRSFT